MQNEKKANPFQELLERAGISEQAMAQHLAMKTGGSVQEWSQAISSGKSHMFQDSTAENSKAYFKQNEGVFHAAMRAMNGQ